MSRYVISDDGEREVVVGWDPPLGTFFAQISVSEQKLGPEDDDVMLFEIGQLARQVVTLAELQLALEEQGVTVPNVMWEQLAKDEAAPWEPGPLQRKLGFLGKDTPYGDPGDEHRERGCAACAGDPEAHGLHVCGLEDERDREQGA